MINEFEKSNVTLIAFSSYEKNYSLIFDDYNDFEYRRDNTLNWISYAYIYLFINQQVTFETLFILFPIKEMIKLFPLYHEMSITKLDEVFYEKTKYSLLDGIMNKKEMSSYKLAELTGISVSTIKALRYNKRDLNKLQYSYVREIAKYLNIKIESLFFLKLEIN
jgi:DNA-binding Xre family transcriptional regulator